MSDLSVELEQLRARVAEYDRREQEAAEREAGLRRDLAMYQLVIDHLPMRVFWKDAVDLRYLGCNLGFAQDSGRQSPSDMIGDDDFHMGWAEQADAYRADDRHVLNTRQGRPNYEERQSRPDGEAWLRTSKIPLIDADGALVGVLGTYEDITEHRAAEQARIEYQERLIAAQQDSLRELSTPLIPLAENVVAMPLVGTIDTRRAAQIMETLLEGIAALQADIALLDVSGVRVIDTQVADAILRAARAAKLLGAQVVLTGMSAEIAQTVVHLGADMSGIITLATLREGMQYAASRATETISGS
ncbi:PAS domain-containing protein [Oscillochloris sp. ZM17-4]|uniref:STAS domain-containing protein n=1 Tax=Oscillochloris sp. ZM17-4 TaxID=2866714 RepID=UPI001C7389FB|nr:STAS domain-containing protein [Oscillochloris sp. ZM17-4]MBX0330124.1 PAS domain-containing protein [Oscillochloris sp. ZM17-4]